MYTMLRNTCLMRGDALVGLELDLYIGQWISFLDRKAADVAKKIGINEGYLSQLISGHKHNPSYLMIRAIADELGVGIDTLRKPPPSGVVVEALRGLDPGVVNRILGRPTPRFTRK